MSKEKIIGLSVIGVLTATLASVTAWRMMGGKAASPEPAALVADDKAQVVGAENNSTGPTVLASATSSNDELADRLSGKTKIKGGWETASSRSMPVDPTLPAGSQPGTESSLASYGAKERATDTNSGASDQERHPSYMPRETVEASSAAAQRYATDEATGATAAVGDLASGTASEAGTNDTALEVPNELAPDLQAVAGTRTNETAFASADAAGNYGTTEQGTIQIVEPQTAGQTTLAQQVESESEAEQAATRAADDARFARAYAKEQEKVTIAEAALEPQAASSYVVQDESSSTETEATASPNRFTPDARSTTDARYAPAEDHQQQVETLPKNVTPTEATAPEAGGQIPPRAGYSDTVPPTDAYRAQPSYRDSVYREPAAVSGAGSAPIPKGAQYIPGTAATAPAANPYAAPTQSPAVSPYGASARPALGSTGNMHPAVAEKHVPQRENTGKYYVEPGDSFWTISKKVYGNGGFFKALQEHNRARFITPSNLQVGDEVLTPTVAELRDLYSGLCPKERIAKPGSPAATQAAHLPVAQTGDVRHYEVQAGDTLYDIARYELGDGSRWPEIYQLNRVAIGVDIDHVRPGTRLMLPMDAPLKNSPEGEGYRGDILTRKPGGAAR